MARGAGMAGSSSMARPFARYVSFNVLGMVGVSVYILADTFFIANGVGSDGLAALNFSIVLYTVLQATGLMLGIGAATEFQVCSARGDRTGANRVFTTALVMAGVAAAVLLAVVEAFATPLASLLGADEATLPLTVTYLRTIFAFAPLFLLNNVLLPFVRNDGSPQLAMVAMLVGSFGNIALDALFVFGFGWGMFGAAFATGFAPLMSMAVLLIHFLRKRNTFRPVRLHLRARLVGHIAALGFSSFVVELSGGLVLLVLNLVILAFEGTIGVAAYGVVANFAFVASALFVGIAQGIQPLASNAYARGSDRDVRAVLRLALLTALVIAATTYAAVALAAEPLALAFNRDNDPRSRRLPWTACACTSSGTSSRGRTSWRRRSSARWSNRSCGLAISIVRGSSGHTGVRAVLAALFGMAGVWATFPAAEAATFALTAVLLVRFVRGPRRRDREVVA